MPQQVLKLNSMPKNNKGMMKINTGEICTKETNKAHDVSIQVKGVQFMMMSVTAL